MDHYTYCLTVLWPGDFRNDTYFTSAYKSEHGAASGQENEESFFFLLTAVNKWSTEDSLNIRLGQKWLEGKKEQTNEQKPDKISIFCSRSIPEKRKWTRKGDMYSATSCSSVHSNLLCLISIIQYIFSPAMIYVYCRFYHPGSHVIGW